MSNLKFTKKDFLLMLGCIIICIIVSIASVYTFLKIKEGYTWTMTNGITENNGMYIHDTPSGTYDIPTGGHTYRLMKFYSRTGGGDFNLLSFKCLDPAWSNIQVIINISGWIPGYIGYFSGMYMMTVANNGWDNTSKLMIINPIVDPNGSTVPIIEYSPGCPKITGWSDTTNKIIYVSLFWLDGDRPSDMNRYGWSCRVTADIQVNAGGDARWTMVVI